MQGNRFFKFMHTTAVSNLQNRFSGSRAMKTSTHCSVAIHKASVTDY